MVTRRNLLIALGLASLSTASPALAQRRSGKIPRIGVLWHAGSKEEEGEYFRSFQQGFRDLGHVEGKTFVLENRFAGEKYDRFKSFAAELVALNVDVLVAVTGPGARAAQAATKTIPIVFVVAPDPLGANLVASLSRPGGNITGLTTMAIDITGKRLELLKDMVPRLSRAALLVNPNDAPFTRRVIEKVQTVAGRLNVIVRPFEAGAPEELDRAFAMIAQEGMHGVFTSNDPMFFNERKRIADLALAHRLPVLLQNQPGARAGALMSYGADSRTIFRRAPAFVDKILKGSKPGELPVEQPTKFELVVNLKTAKALGITIPQSILVRAEMIE